MRRFPNSEGNTFVDRIRRAARAPKRGLVDATPTKEMAVGIAADLNASARTCGAVVRKLRKAQDGGRLKYGVYVLKSCPIHGRGL